MIIKFGLYDREGHLWMGDCHGPVRFTATEIVRIRKAAKNADQAASRWIRSVLGAVIEMKAE